VPTGTTAGKERKRRTVAGGVIAGQDTAAIAAAAGCQTRYVQRLANEPETQFLITELLQPHRAKLQRMAARAVYAVNTALLAKRTDKQDHIVRLRAVERYGDLIALAQGKPQEKTGEGAQVTWEQFTLMYEKRTVTTL
jgi:hypothetical protein